MSEEIDISKLQAQNAVARRGCVPRSSGPNENPAKKGDSMKVTVEVTQDDLAEMGVTAEQLEDAVTIKIEGGFDIEGDVLFINSANVTVVINDALHESDTAPM